jgi:peroxiredoxin
MRKTILAVALVLLVGYIYYLWDTSGVRRLVGKPAPDFSAMLLNGEKVTLGSYLGKQPIVLDFFATWCPPCRMSLPFLNALHAELADRGLVVFAVNHGETADVVKRYWEQNRFSVPVIIDPTGTASAYYFIHAIPQTVLIDKSGNVVHIVQGFAEGSESEIRSLALKLLEP